MKAKGPHRDSQHNLQNLEAHGTSKTGHNNNHKMSSKQRNASFMSVAENLGNPKEALHRKKGRVGASMDVTDVPSHHVDKNMTANFMNNLQNGHFNTYKQSNNLNQFIM